MSNDFLIETISNYMIVTGCSNTMSCNYIFYESELTSHFNIDSKKLVELSQDIKDFLLSCVMVADCQLDQDENNVVIFDVMFYGNYCNVDVDFSE